MKNELKNFGVFAILCAVYCIVIKLLFYVSGDILFRYFLCQIFVVFLPGLALIKILSFQGKLIERISISYAVGYALNIIEYLIVYCFRIQKYALLFSIIIAVIALGIVVKLGGRGSKRNFREEIDSDWYLVLFLFAVYLFVNIIVYSGNVISPLGRQEMTSFERDIQFWCSNAVALKIGFPPTPTYIDGGRLYYHYFSSLQIAYLSQVSGVDVFNLSFTFFPFGKCIILLGGLNYLLNIIGAVKGKLFYFAVIFFMTGEETKSVVTYVWHLIKGPFGFDIGYAFGLWFLGTLIQQWKSNKFDTGLFGLCILFWMTLTGVKAPIAMVLIFTAAIFCFIWLIRKNYKNAFVYGLSIVGIFLVVSIVFAGAMRITSGNYEGASSGLLSFYSIQDVLTERHFNVILSFIHSIANKVYYTHPVLMIITITTSILAISYLLQKKLVLDECILAVVLLGTTIIGLLMGIFIFAGGSSEMYFTMAAFIPCISYNAELWKLYLKKRLIFDKKILRTFKVGIFLISFIGIYNMYFNAYGGGMVTFLNEGNQKIHGNYLFPEGAFTKDEALACIWIRDNTDKEAVVINDRNVIGGKSKDYYVGIFSERQQYLEASDLIYVVDLDSSYNRGIIDEVSRRDLIIKSLYANEKSAFKQLKNEGVDYIIQNQVYTPGFLPDSSLVEFQYRSGGVSVYRIL